MPLDPSIPLSVNPQYPDLGRAAEGANALMVLRQRQQQAQSQNALRGIFADPSSMDPATGQPTPNALRRMMAADPEAGMRAQENALKLQDYQFRMNKMKLERVQSIQDIVTPARDTALNAYDEALKNGSSEGAARQAGQRALSEGLTPIESGGLLSDEEKRMLNRQFDPMRFRAMSLSVKERLAQEEKRKADARAEATQTETKRHNLTEEDIQRDGAGKWEVLTDPERKDEKGETIPATQYRYNPVTAKATTLSGEPYTPAGAAKIGAASASIPVSPELQKARGAMVASGMPMAQAVPGWGKQATD